MGTLTTQLYFYCFYMVLFLYVLMLHDSIA